MAYMECPGFGFTDHTAHRLLFPRCPCFPAFVCQSAGGQGWSAEKQKYCCAMTGQGQDVVDAGQQNQRSFLEEGRSSPK